MNASLNNCKEKQILILYNFLNPKFTIEIADSIKNLFCSHFLLNKACKKIEFKINTPRQDEDVFISHVADYPIVYEQYTNQLKRLFIKNRMFKIALLSV